MENIIYNLDIFNEEQTKLLNDLSKYTDYTVEELIFDINSGKETWDEYEELLEYHEHKNNPNAKYYSMQEVEQSLKTGIILE
ncbi:MAG: hypothetical protein AM1032_000008 [Mycoplasmataceae bacterium]|nr:MAG: hypothetical protein AM1032_000008 [Mycoplasmataceae bacterium]